ncbi:MAG: plastocyanin/azurin family copper-binding protein [Thermoplasmatota archaeon]|nr:hypothetical protein [Halobacteriales archaeon]
MKALAFLPLLALVLAGCGSAPPSAVTPPMEDGKYVIHITTGSMFQPAHAAVPLNSTVVWVSDGGPTHDVTDASGGWSSDDTLGSKMAQGQRYEHTFTTKGLVSYYCKIHKSTGMVADIQVG